MKTIEPQRILVINVTRIGDTLLATPLLRALKAAWPAAEITVAGHRKRIEVLENLPFIDKLRSISKQVAPLLGRIGGIRYDLAIVYGQDEALVDYALRVARHVVAMRQESDDINRRLFAIAGEDGYRPRNAVTGMLIMLRPLRVALDGYYLSYRVTESENQWAQKTLAQKRIAGKLLIGLQLASFPTKAYRDWPVGHFIRLCEKIIEAHPDVYFLIFGGSLEADRTELVRRHFSGRAASFAGRLTLRQTAALMNQLDLYIGVDTGPTHIMGALHRPMLSLYHPTAPSRALAPQEHPCCFAIDHPLADKGASFDTPMAEISVEEVWNHVQAALAGERPTPRTPEWLAYDAAELNASGRPHEYNPGVPIAPDRKRHAAPL